MISTCDGHEDVPSDLGAALPLPRVLVVSNFLSSSIGTRGACEELSIRLEAAGHGLITTSKIKNRAIRLIDMAATCWRYREHYDVAQVDVFSGPAFFWAEAVGSILVHLRKPFVLSLHGGNLPRFAQHWPKRVRWLFNSATAITAPSLYLKEQMAHFRPDIMLVPNALDVARYRWQPRSILRPRLVWVRAFHKIYNPSLAVQALAVVRKRYPSADLVMAGPDKGDGSLQAARTVAHDLGVSNHVRFIGKVAKTEVPQVIGEGEIFLNTTNVDNTPVTLLEAMACGTPVVTTKVGGIPYMFEDNMDALMVPAQDLAAMSGAVTRLMEDPALAARLARNARAKVEQFDWPNVLDQWQGILAQGPVARDFGASLFSGKRAQLNRVVATDAPA